MPASADPTIPLTSLQAGMVYQHLREGGDRGTDVVQVEVELGARVDPAALRKAWQTVVAREPMLRLAARWQDEQTPVGVIHPELPLEFEQRDFSALAGDRREERYRQALHEDEIRGFDLDDPPLMRVTLYRLDDDDLRMVWTLHHLIADGWSYALVLDDVFALHDAGDAQDGTTLPERPPYTRFIEWLEGREGEGDRDFWSGLLDGIQAPPPLPGETAERDEQPAGRRTYLHDTLGPDQVERLREVASQSEATLNTLLQAAWALTLSRFGMGDDLTFGAIRGGRAGTVDGTRDMVGLFIQTVPVRVRLDQHDTLDSILRALRGLWVDMRAHEHAPIADIQRWSGVPPGTLPFRSVLNVQDPFWGDHLTEREGPWQDRRITLHNRLVYPLTVAANAGSELSLRFEFDPGTIDPEVMRTLLGSFVHVLRSLGQAPERPLAEVDALSRPERQRVLERLHRAADEADSDDTVHDLVARQAAAAPDEAAIDFGDLTWTRAELDGWVRRIANRLVREGVKPGDRVGIALERGPEMIAAMLGAMTAGAAYVPIDPHYPEDRVRLMVEDAGLSALLTRSRLVSGLGDLQNADDPGARLVRLDDDSSAWERESTAPVDRGVDPSDLAYVIYTSGSTGRPKGVMVEHRNVVNFFRGMDEVLGDPAGKRWLAVTSISFDISVLELLWTLARGARVVLHPERNRVAVPAAGRTKAAPANGLRPMRFSLFYFSAEGGEGESAPKPGRDRYRLLLEGSRIADEGGLDAIWTPERHFHEFGGIYPNPSVAGAAVAAITERVRIRAGSVVLPLHDTIRVAEEWSVVDNLSDGRVDLSFASGWHDRDFIFAPNNFDDRKEVMFREIESLRALWRGESITRESPKTEVTLTIHPRPVQPELPFWVTAGGSPETFRRAGEIGGNLLTHLLGQSPAELEDKIRVYREAWDAAGHPGRGHVSLMLHTYIGPDMDDVMARVREPFRNYLSTSVGLIKAMAQGDGKDLKMAELSDEDMEALLDHAFNRYFETSALMGTFESNLEMVESLRDRDVDEIACLADFGVDDDATLRSMERIPELMARANAGVNQAEPPQDDAGRSAPDPDAAQQPASPASMDVAPDSLPASVGESIRRYGVTHLQCTPSMARLVLAESDPGLEQLETLLIGGEAFPGSLAGALRARMGDGRILNMYGPTETTIWSSVCEVDEHVLDAPVVPLGRPIRNTVLLVLDPEGRLVPPSVPGELFIGGDGVVRGYLDRPELTQERFVASTLPEYGGRLYRTGDRVRLTGNGTLQFLGRTDHQVKIRGHRVELGEIEAALTEHPGVDAAVAKIWSRDGDGTSDRLVAYMVCSGDTPDDPTLRGHLEQLLPDVMIPSDFVELSEFPLTPNAKIDRNRLPEPRRRERTSTPTAAGDANRPNAAGEGRGAGGLQKMIAAIWSEILDVDQVGLDDNFFDLGGHSLLTVRVHSRLTSEADVPVSITDLFRNPTVRSLAAHLAGETESEAELSGVQERAQARRGALAQRRRRRST